MSPNTQLLPTRAPFVSLINHPDFVWETIQTKNKFDEPYSPIIGHDAGAIGEDLHHNTRHSLALWFSKRRCDRGAEHAQSWWDRVVLFCFCFSLVALLYTLAGLGLAEHDHANCAPILSLPPSAATPVDATAVLPVIWGKKSVLDADKEALDVEGIQGIDGNRINPAYMSKHVQPESHLVDTQPPFALATIPPAHFDHRHAYFHEPRFFLERLAANPRVVHHLADPAGLKETKAHQTPVDEKPTQEELPFALKSRLARNNARNNDAFLGRVGGKCRGSGTRC
ncbi:hypothetical protein FIBSPDRAFT_307219 [Athelia psychrophila]|uniref:Uncharacterized protein n=1 Tax=Athelia psychrophila TaxID=1759441 RepID=A0A166W6V9_9AGAM|nr:hypothetical protein FIBSPDRAFT_307219 [Fibularhizoctonia sp. CBS 109695]